MYQVYATSCNLRQICTGLTTLCRNNALKVMEKEEEETNSGAPALSEGCLGPVIRAVRAFFPPPLFGSEPAGSSHKVNCTQCTAYNDASLRSHDTLGYRRVASQVCREPKGI